MAIGETVNVVRGRRPLDYHCDCAFCKVSLGELRPPGGGYYSRLERREYYADAEKGKGGHVAKTPLHIARWAVQRFTLPGDWVLDPTIGAGTTAVESVTQGRNVAGMEIQFGDVLKANVKKNRRDGVRAEVRIGDARRVGAFLDDLGVKFSLVVNNPPYSGDEHAGTGTMNEQGTKEGGEKKSWTTTYKEGLPNLAFLKEGQEYWDAMGAIYSDCARHLVPGGHLVVGVKDMMRAKKPFLLHLKFCELLRDVVGMEFVGTAFLKHHPTTLFLNTYFRWYGVHPPYYQTISVFKKR